MDTVQLGSATVSRVILGGNPFSGFSHQGPQRDLAMRRHYSVAQIKDVLRQAEALGVTAHISRTDAHVMRYLLEYRQEGGRIQWIAQTASELPLERAIGNAIAEGAVACFIHGGTMDHLMAAGGLDRVPAAIERLRRAGLAAGIAGHDVRIFRWAQQTRLPVDFYMCSYYNPSVRDSSPDHVASDHERFDDRDRAAMVACIAELDKPAIHYKVLAAGRLPPAEALAFVRRHLRPQDAVCLGICTADKPDMLAEDIALLEGSPVCGA